MLLYILTSAPSVASTAAVYCFAYEFVCVCTCVFLCVCVHAKLLSMLSSGTKNEKKMFVATSSVGNGGKFCNFSPLSLELAELLACTHNVVQSASARHKNRGST